MISFLLFTGIKTRIKNTIKRKLQFLAVTYRVQIDTRQVPPTSTFCCLALSGVGEVEQEKLTVAS